MRKMMIYILFIVCTIACTKSIHTPDQSEKPVTEPLAIHTNDVLESAALTRDLGPAILKITAEPNVVCYSYQNGEAPKPCNIFVAFNCSLSNPLDRYVKVEIVRTNMVTNDKNDAAVEPLAKMVIIIAPHTTKFTLVSGMTTTDNNHIPEGEFKISDVHWYNQVD